jgi:hypothetical protein
VAGPQHLAIGHQGATDGHSAFVPPDPGLLDRDCQELLVDGPLVHAFRSSDTA